MPQSIAQVIVRGRGLLVTAATPAAEAIARRPLLGMPLSESMCEEAYRSVLDRLRWTVDTGEPSTTIVKAPDGTVGRVVTRAVADGAVAVFQSVRYAIHEVYGPDLICGPGNDLFIHRVQREFRGLAAREAFPEAAFAAAQDMLRWVMRTGRSKVIPLPDMGERMGAFSPRPGVVRTAGH